jgi:hypothetical protein
LAPVLANEVTLFDQLDTLAWAEVPISAYSVGDDRGRHELRTLQVLPAPLGLTFPHIAEVFLIERTVTIKGCTTYQAMFYITSLTDPQASPADLLA